MGGRGKWSKRPRSSDAHSAELLRNFLSFRLVDFNVRGDDLIRSQAYQIATTVVAWQVPELQHFNLVAVFIDAVKLDLFWVCLVMNDSNLTMDITFILELLVEREQDGLFSLNFAPEPEDLLASARKFHLKILWWIFLNVEEVESMAYLGLLWTWFEASKHMVHSSWVSRGRIC